MQDHAVDRDTQLEFGDGATESANDDAENKAESVGYEDGDYAFVQTPEGDLFMQVSGDTTPVWGLRSVNDHKSHHEDTQAYGSSTDDAANEDAVSKAESVGYEMGDYAFV